MPHLLFTRGVKNTWYNFTDNVKNPWNQPDTLNPEDGSYIFGDYYMRNMSIWAVLLALMKTNPDLFKDSSIIPHSPQ